MLNCFIEFRISIPSIKLTYIHTYTQANLFSFSLYVHIRDFHAGRKLSLKQALRRFLWAAQIYYERPKTLFKLSSIWIGKEISQFFQKSPYFCLLVFLMPSMAFPMLIHVSGTPCKQYKYKRWNDERWNSVLLNWNFKSCFFAAKTRSHSFSENCKHCKP